MFHSNSPAQGKLSVMKVGKDGNKFGPISNLAVTNSSSCPLMHCNLEFNAAVIMILFGRFIYLDLVDCKPIDLA